MNKRASGREIMLGFLSYHLITKKVDVDILLLHFPSLILGFPFRSSFFFFFSSLLFPLFMCTNIFLSNMIIIEIIHDDDSTPCMQQQFTLSQEYALTLIMLTHKMGNQFDVFSFEEG